MKKTKLLVLTLVTCLFVSILTGCNNNKQVITETAETFLQALVNADVTIIYDLCTDDMISYHELETLDLAYTEEFLYESMEIEKDTLNADAQAAVTKFCQETIDKSFTDYSITSVDVKKQTGTVIATVTGIPSDAADILDSQEVNEQVDELINTYTESNMDSLLEVYEADGEDAMITQMYNDLIPEMLQIMQDSMLSLEPEEQQILFYVQKIDDKWYITNSIK